MNTRFLIGFSILSAAGLAGCATAERHLCNRAEECDVIESDDVDECVDDLEHAIEDEVIDKKDVRECLSCMEDNSCGIDIAVDCADDCETVGAIVYGSNFH